jgi:hypothetical protein
MVKGTKKGEAASTPPPVPPPAAEGKTTTLAAKPAKLKKPKVGSNWASLQAQLPKSRGVKKRKRDDHDAGADALTAAAATNSKPKVAAPILQKVAEPSDYVAIDCEMVRVVTVVATRKLMSGDRCRWASASAA